MVQITRGNLTSKPTQSPMFSISRRAVAKSAIGCAVYAGAAVWSIWTYEDPAPKGRIVFAVYPPFTKVAGAEYQTNPITAPLFKALKELDDEADANDAAHRSNLLLYEDDKLLGPPHSVHSDIATLGEGRYSHWKDVGIRFSASDNSDPNINGRRYWAVIPIS
ncbi:hypothetical protein ACVSQB_24285 [Bradyrhizobium elkanii]